MPPPTLELADIFRQHGPAYRQSHRLPLHQHRLMQAIENCRTPVLGGVVEWCDRCQYTHIHYRSCRNRHCPKCQGEARAKWLEKRTGELLPVEYFHVVFTLPEEIAAIAFYNREAIYDLLFATVSETLLTIARDPKHLGAEIGFSPSSILGGMKSSSASSLALRGPGRRALTGRSVGGLPSGVLPASARAQPPFSPSLSGSSAHPPRRGGDCNFRRTQKPG